MSTNPMDKFKATFKLKQHTPIIHFQSDQKGATLRATELKPKFDRFLIKQFEKEGIDYKSFLISGQERALDYKVKVETDNSISKEIEENNALYFAARKPREMSQEQFDKTKKYFKKNPNEFKIEFFSFNKELLNSIELNFSLFLVLENFGTRQNKGFGSFYLSKNDKRYKEPIDALNTINKHYIYANYDRSDVQAHVEVIYPLMKTGINFPDYKKKDHKDGNGNNKKIPDPSQGRGNKASYYKSYIFQYMLEQTPPIGNEKRFIKENFFDNNLRVTNDNIEKRYVRALLGVSDGVEFKDHERRGEIAYSNNEIDRFKSPLTFKIIDNKMIIIANEINEKLFNQEFTFTYRGNKEIRTPKKEEFDINDFIDSFADYFNEVLKVDKPESKQNIFDKKIMGAKRAKFRKVSK